MRCKIKYKKKGCIKYNIIRICLSTLKFNTYLIHSLYNLSSTLHFLIQERLLGKVSITFFFVYVM